MYNCLLASWGQHVIYYLHMDDSMGPENFGIPTRPNFKPGGILPRVEKFGGGGSGPENDKKIEEWSKRVESFTIEDWDKGRKFNKSHESKDWYDIVFGNGKLNDSGKYGNAAEFHTREKSTLLLVPLSAEPVRQEALENHERLAVAVCINYPGEEKGKNGRWGSWTSVFIMRPEEALQFARETVSDPTLPYRLVEKLNDGPLQGIDLLPGERVEILANKLLGGKIDVNTPSKEFPSDFKPGALIEQIQEPQELAWPEEPKPEAEDTKPVKVQSGLPGEGSGQKPPKEPPTTPPPPEAEGPEHEGEDEDKEERDERGFWERLREVAGPVLAGVGAGELLETVVEAARYYPEARSAARVISGLRGRKDKGASKDEMKDAFREVLRERDEEERKRTQEAAGGGGRPPEPPVPPVLSTETPPPPPSPEEPEGGERKEVSWQGRPWSRIYADLKSAMDQELDIRDPVVQGLLKEKYDLIENARADTFLSPLWEIQARIDRIYVSNPNELTEVSARWREMETEIGQINASDLERDAVMGMSQQQIKEFKRLYGGLFDAVKNTLSREWQMRDMAARGIFTSQDGERYMGHDKKQKILGFTEFIPSHLQEVGRWYENVMEPERIRRGREVLGLVQQQAQAEEARTRAESATENGVVGHYEGRPVVEEKAKVRGYFGEDFIRDHELPQYVLLEKLTYLKKVDMETMLFKLYKGQPSEGFDIDSITRGMLAEAGEREGRELSELEKGEITAKAADIFNNFMYGIYPMMSLNLLESNHTLRTWVGPEGQGGTLYKVQPNMRWIAQELKKDRQAVKALRVWIALGGTDQQDYRKIPETTPEEREITDKHFTRFKEMMMVKEYDKIGKNEVMSHDLAKREMDQVAQELEALGIGKAIVALTREMANFIVWTPESVDARKQIAKFEKDLLRGDTKAPVPPVRRTMYAKGPTFDMYLAKYGVEGMLDQFVTWTHSKDWLMLTYDGMQSLIKNLQIMDDMKKGNDAYPNLAGRRKALNEIIDKMMVHKEFTPVDEQTALRWRKMPLYGGTGEAAAGKRFATWDVPGQVGDAFGGEIEAVKNVGRFVKGIFKK